MRCAINSTMMIPATALGEIRTGSREVPSFSAAGTLMYCRRRIVAHLMIAGATFGWGHSKRLERYAKNESSKFTISRISRRIAC